METQALADRTSLHVPSGNSVHRLLSIYTFVLFPVFKTQTDPPGPIRAPGESLGLKDAGCLDYGRNAKMDKK